MTHQKSTYTKHSRKGAHRENLEVWLHKEDLKTQACIRAIEGAIKREIMSSNKGEDLNMELDNVSPTQGRSSVCYSW
jgi:hypothetical protein